MVEEMEVELEDLLAEDVEVWVEVTHSSIWSLLFQLFKGSFKIFPLNFLS